MEVHVRWMIRRDLPEVLEIESNCFEFPWLEEDFITCLQERNCIGMVAEYDENVVGYMIYELHKKHIHILNFAVSPDCQRQSVATQLINKLINKLSVARRTELRLEIRESNLVALSFFKKMGFKAVAIIHEFYEDTNDDAYIMKYKLSTTYEDVLNILQQRQSSKSLLE